MCIRDRQGLAIIMIIEGELKFTTVGNTTMLTEGQIEIINVKETVKLEAVADECRLWFLYFERIFVDSIRDDFEYVLYNCKMCIRDSHSGEARRHSAAL